MLMIADLASTFLGIDVRNAQAARQPRGLWRQLQVAKHVLQEVLLMLVVLHAYLVQQALSKRREEHPRAAVAPLVKHQSLVQHLVICVRLAVLQKILGRHTAWIVQEAVLLVRRAALSVSSASWGDIPAKAQ
eukprot:gnl/MRDRNA2_/MRDRNA2_54029_c0_seq1.p1 gnl/MRDRNA2_/MRDRNA2_54029_c0~~gnl/MRDRNA2_/MRDRNA2_54029_c0_seq1.p1  ORF type:complete len:132 (+),score=20.24 gnl/MRDRNA2_/MRDRNA2_54029_c0_seq1:69-464(+)